MSASRTRLSTDPSGAWDVYSTYQDSADVYHDAPSVQLKATTSKPVELLALLTAPATLEIQQGALVQRQDFPEGLQSYTVPLKAGITPVFRMPRSGQDVFEVTSSTPVKTSTSYPGLVYHGGTSVQCTRP